MTPIYILSGQSNAVFLNNVDTFRQRILAAEPDAIVIEYAVGATTVFKDWYAGNDGLAGTGALFASLVSQIRAAVEKNPDAYIAGMGWIQGEHDAAYGYGLSYADNLGLFQERLTEIFGEFPLAVMALSDNASPATSTSVGPSWRQVQDGQIKIAEDRESVTLLDPDDIAQAAGILPTRMFSDGVHYTVPVLQALGNELADHLLAIDQVNDVKEPAQVNVDKIELIYRTVYGWAAANKLAGLAGNDMILGRAGNDTLDGLDGQDRLLGEEDDDVLNGGNGNDILSGGTGKDSFVFNGASGQDVIEDFDLTADQLSFADVASVSEFEQSVNGKGDLVLSWDYAGETQSLTLVGLTKADFTSINFGPDMLHDTVSTDDPAPDDAVHGSAANDMLYGTTGNDKIFAQGGSDTLYGDDGDDELSGDDGNDGLYGDAGNDHLRGGNGNDAIWGGTGNDTLEGGAGSDFLTGEAGADDLIGGEGNDILAGGSGADSFVFSRHSGLDMIRDFNLADDLLTFVDLSSAEDISASQDASGHLVLSWEYDGGAQSLTLRGLKLADFDSVNFAFDM